MKLKKTSVMLGVAALSALATPSAMAQNYSGWYLGGNLGRTGASIDDDRITRGLAGQGLVTTSIEDRDTDRGYKVFGGYQLNRNFAVEAGYFDLGSFGYTAQTVPAGSLTGDIRIKGVNLDLVGIWPITDRFSALGRVGVTSARTKGNFSSTGLASVPYANANPNERATNVKFGAGLMYDFTPSLGMRVEAERYRINDSVGNKGHVDMVSVGLVYRFGASSPAPRAAAPAPMYVAPSPPPPAAPGASFGNELPGPSRARAKPECALAYSAWRHLLHLSLGIGGKMRNALGRHHRPQGPTPAPGHGFGPDRYCRRRWERTTGRSQSAPGIGSNSDAFRVPSQAASVRRLLISQ